MSDYCSPCLLSRPWGTCFSQRPGGFACFCHPSTAGAAAEAGIRLWLLRAFSCRIQAALKKYQTEQRSKGDSLDKCQAELKKLRKKSQGSKNPQKYSDKELQVGPWAQRGGTSIPCRAADAWFHVLEVARLLQAF